MWNIIKVQKTFRNKSSVGGLMKSYNYRQDILTDTFQIGELLLGDLRGIVDAMPAAKYHGATAYTSSSDLKYLHSKSPFHYHVMKTTGVGRVKQTDEMIKGSMLHCLLLNPEDFESEFYLLPEMDRRTKVGREAYQIAMDNAGERIVASVDLYEEAKLMLGSVKENQRAMELLGPCKTEVSYFWKCAFSSLSMRARVDACTADYMIEVKTSRSAEPSAFERQAFNMSYDLSASHYCEGMRAQGDDRPRTVYFLVVENYAPFVTQVYKADELFMESGHDKWMSAVTKLESAMATDKWIGYSPEPVLPLSAPKWSVKNVEGVEDGI